MSGEIRIRLGERSYRAVVALLPTWGASDLPELTERGGTAVLVTEETVGPLWADPVGEFFEVKGSDSKRSVARAGEG
jgi:hypothetical protein